MIIQLLSRYNFIQVKRSCTRHASVNDQVAEAPRTIRFKEQERDGGGDYQRVCKLSSKYVCSYFMHWQKKVSIAFKFKYLFFKKNTFCDF